LSGERELPHPGVEEPTLPGTVTLRDGEVRGLSVRIASLWIAPNAPGAQPVLLQVAETREKQSVLATEIIKGVLLPQFAILPLAVLLIWLALVRGIKPLSIVEARIRERRPGDLSPLDESAVPLEVVPLVLSVNDLLNKLNDSIGTQKRFLADAAHQLKTPLAGLRMQADLAQREGANADELKQSLKQIGRASVRATHTVNQLLSLARAESSGASIARQPCDLARLTIEVVREAVPRAIEKRIDLGYDGAGPGSPGVSLEGNPTLLKELVRNLVDNAINYTASVPARPGVITARVLGDPFGRVILLQVEDNGPGIAESERELVFEPFYRVLGNEADGSGLGLPIVKEIARQHFASVQLEDAHPAEEPPGTRFTLRFDTSHLPADIPAPAEPRPHAFKPAATQGAAFPAIR
ncbi:MAG: sensor histidine kinase N-terminal domain-containing protein, partial [Gammaproteobacteria bacterium]|nr:sensor histidine kinase N-terminal domain-containing protein [Gammaproteobacteria bacterium]